MNLPEVILLSIITFLLFAGVHQSIANGFVNSYWIFMLAFIVLSIFMMVRARNNRGEKQKVK